MTISFLSSILSGDKGDYDVCGAGDEAKGDVDMDGLLWMYYI